ncbi:hypothetical protein PybrP1_003817 [[Pythium] brassicae (nom. inval.)]|nr:hypothetical protein PybrP1_003817 [[Pythium] brassicae (nom. inval.)]
MSSVAQETPSAAHASPTTAAMVPPPPPSPTRSRLPALHYAISHGGADRRLPAFALAYDSSASDDDALLLTGAHCATPHFAPGVAPFYPEASPTLKTPAAATPLARYCSSTTTSNSSSSAAAAAAAEELTRRKKGTRRGTLNPEAKSVLKAWMFSPEHFAHPYPSEEEKEELASEAGIEVKQLSNWFTNARKRLWQPVLRQSGVEVKNFLSTGRGGPRGSKLDVPPNLQSLVPPSPPPSPRQRSNSSAFSETSTASSSSSTSSPLKRAWADVEASLPPAADDASAGPKRKKTSATAAAATRKKSASRKATATAAAPAMAQVASQLSQELRLALAERAAATAQSDEGATFQELEILAATSLIGLHQQQYQPVH